jgi:N-formylglutamate amidohydrolase
LERVLVVVPHCSCHVPYDIAAAMLGKEHLTSVDRRDLEKRHLLQSDPYTDHIFHLPGAAHLYATVSRFVVDLNRAPQDLSANGVVKSNDFDGNPLYPAAAEPDRTEREHRIRRYWAPFHRQLEQQLATASVDLLVDAHSMTPTGPVIGPDHGRPRPAFTLGNLGSEGGECLLNPGWVTISPAIARELAARLDAYAADLLEDWPADLRRVTLNTPFAGGGTLRTYCDPQREHRVAGFAIEINRSLYLDSAGEPKWREIERLNRVMRALVDDALRAVEAARSGG